jgi:hypothetical protein
MKRKAMVTQNVSTSFVHTKPINRRKVGRGCSSPESPGTGTFFKIAVFVPNVLELIFLYIALPFAVDSVVFILIGTSRQQQVHDMIGCQRPGPQM